MHKLAPLTKLILTVFVSVWALMLQSIPALTVLIVVQLLLLLLAKPGAAVFKGLGGLTFFAAILAGIQYMFGSGIVLAVVTGLRMLSMTVVFILLLATTRIQDITASLVTQCRIPHEYAFMFTSALRFIPDFIAESKAVREAQACRGFAVRGNIVKRILSYVAVVEPLVLKAVSRSETMAMSLELRGFGSRGVYSFGADVGLALKDYLLLLGMVVVTAVFIVL